MLRQIKTMVVGLILLFMLAGGLPAAAHAQTIGPATSAATVSASGSAASAAAGQPQAAAPALAAFTYSEDAAAQASALATYLAANNLPGRVVQVALSQYPKVSQYTDINATAAGYGPNACGLVAAAMAVGGSHWTALVSQIAQAAGSNYGANTGIQPSKYAAALQAVLGSQNVAAKNAMTLGTLYEELQAGNIVIVDLKVNAYRVVPAASGATYAHFARVLGIDAARQQVYIENTLQGGAYWTVSFDTFVRAWTLPETSATLTPDAANAEAVTGWAVILNPSLKTSPAL